MVRSPVSLKPMEENAKTNGLRKGAWTAEEDEKLVTFICKNGGHGSWRTLPKLAGLDRCGKSCRLRWTNYLRPNIKRGDYTEEEERTIIRLHGLLGNKWSSIASHLSGRTDNDIKNHWNTYLKKKLAKVGIDPLTHLPFNIVACNNIYNQLLTSTSFIQQPQISNELLKFHFPASLQLLQPPTDLYHFLHGELARLEAEEARKKAVSAYREFIQNSLLCTSAASRRKLPRRTWSESLNDSSSQFIDPAKIYPCSDNDQRATNGLSEPQSDYNTILKDLDSFLSATCDPDTNPESLSYSTFSVPMNCSIAPHPADASEITLKHLETNVCDSIASPSSCITNDAITLTECADLKEFGIIIDPNYCNIGKADDIDTDDRNSLLEENTIRHLYLRNCIDQTAPKGFSHV
ncbi:hypothetical protein KP509_25G024900 [Ceratopteris richardii]|uniref:Uncharacterized protein n=1 Tax=Ceratopteris richardii TaxID=49495 RepID=A0A8T2RRH1_CERRI|nr:hypothetical protein KP509_25G024900 [Ceratopteris richardii]